MRNIVVVTALILATRMVFGDATIPRSDVGGSHDTTVVGRFAGSFIVAYDHKDFDALTLPLSPLKPVAGKTDEHNNVLHEPLQKKSVEGERTHLVYLLPAGTAPLQAVRNYESELANSGGKTLFSCKDTECGGDATRSSEGGGGNMSLAMYLWPEKKVKDPSFSNGACAQTSRTSEQRYTLIELAKSNALVSVLAYQVNNTLYCKAFHDRTVVVVDVMQTRPMEQKMVTVKAEEMAQSISATGRVALYGLYFDSARADVKPESADTLAQIARLMTNTPSLKLLVVGHTDNVGDFSANMDLSKRRAESVISALSSQYRIDRRRLRPVGVSYASPIAANGSEDGRAKNRRVELVQDN